jgi:hypothetical protein
MLGLPHPFKNKVEINEDYIKKIIVLRVEMEPTTQAARLRNHSI